MSCGSQIQKATIIDIQSTELIRKGKGEISLKPNNTAAKRAKTLTNIIISLISLLEMKWYRRACSTFPLL
jgi:hypothetical protein